MNRQPPEDKRCTVVQSRSAVRWVKVAWLGSLLTARGAPAVRMAAKAALMSIDADHPRNLVNCLRVIASDSLSDETKRLAEDAALIRSKSWPRSLLRTICQTVQSTLI